ncbi:MAG: hypothetical protein ACYS8X_12675, partial [Planctomycetota bacterium]
QVYRVKLLELDAPDGPIGHLEVGGCYAVKILIPPSSAAASFRDALYAAGFQAPFSLQCNPTAARAGALWQTLIRRSAKMRFGHQRAVTEIHATFVDSTLGSCGEISEWIDGRTWRFETDDHLSLRRQWKLGQSREHLGSPEYLSKREFMAGVVEMLHEMGAPELARQYEWWTCKSQPNCLKRTDCDDDPEAGLTAVDFRAGLALLPCLPMSPRDVTLIGRGLARGSLVQFDRGNLDKLQSFVDARREHFADLSGAVEELKAAETAYRDSQIDITHNLPRLMYSSRLWGTILDSTVESWRVRNITDDAATAALRPSRIKTLLFGLWNLTPAASIIVGLVVVLRCLFRWRVSWVEGIASAALLTIGPIITRFIRTLIGRGDMRRHYGQMLTGPAYLWQAVRAHIIESLVRWHRGSRLDHVQVRRVLKHPWLYLVHKPLSLLPVPFHRILTDWRYAIRALHYVVVRPLKLVFNAELREAWMRQMIKDGRKRGMITDREVGEIEATIADPYIQKYLKSLAVHVCTLPVTQVVSIIVAIVAVANHPEWTWKEAWAYALGIIGLFQVVPISPGSITRGLYVVYLTLRERNFKDYNIAVFMSFFKYIGYLAFPIQMARRYPTLSRFMAGHWATGAVNIVPVFGERGALLEHGVFDLFFNYPLTVRRRQAIIHERRAQRPARFWHAGVLAATGAAAFFAVDWLLLTWRGHIPEMRNLWYAAIAVPLLVGRYVARWAGGARASRRILAALVAGLAMGVMNSVTHTAWKLIASGEAETMSDLPSALLANLGGLASRCAWHAFTFAIFAVIGAFVAEMFVAEPKEKTPATNI